MECLRNNQSFSQIGHLFHFWQIYILIMGIEYQTVSVLTTVPLFLMSCIATELLLRLFSMNFRQRYPQSPVKALLVVQCKSLRFVDMDLPSRAKSHQFYNSEILKRRFSELRLQKANCSHQQTFQTRNLMETIHS